METRVRGMAEMAGPGEVAAKCQAAAWVAGAWEAAWAGDVEMAAGTRLLNSRPP